LRHDPNPIPAAIADVKSDERPGCYPFAPISLYLGDIGFYPGIFLPVYLTAGIPVTENIERVLARLRVIFAVRAIRIAPVSEARKKYKHEAEPEKPTPAEIQAIPIRMIHVILPSIKIL
jgi:hypothetical protein